MSQLTKKAIADVTLKLAASRPVNKIKISDIVTECGITRNTFYYYYKDIYDVLNQVLEDEIAEVLLCGETDESEFFALAEFMMRNKSVLKNISAAIGDKRLTAHLSKKLHGVIVSYIRSEAIGINADECDIAIISVFCEEAILGILTRWLHGDMPKEVQADFFDLCNRIRRLFSGLMRTALTNASKDNIF